MKILGYNPKKTKWRVELWRREAYQETYYGGRIGQIPEAYSWVVLQPDDAPNNMGRSVWPDYYASKQTEVLETYPRNIVIETFLNHSNTNSTRSSMYSNYKDVQDNGMYNPYRLTFLNDGVNTLLDLIGNGTYKVDERGVIGPCILTFVNAAGSCYVRPYNIETEGVPLAQ